MSRASVAAKLNLSLVVGGTRPDGLHELAGVFQRVDIVDRLTIDKAETMRVDGFASDTLVHRALGAIVGATGYEGGFRAVIEKQIPVAAGLGGGSADAGTALRMANELLGAPLTQAELAEIAFGLGSDVTFFLRSGPQLVAGAGEMTTRLELPQDYWVIVALPAGVAKPSTAEIYARFDQAEGERGYAERRAALTDALAGCTRARDLATLPRNDLAPHAGSQALADQLARHGAFRADVSGAGPAVYGLFMHERHAIAARNRLEDVEESWLTVPVW